jgi:O-antigen/teichoic acid export membrane protein
MQNKLMDNNQPGSKGPIGNEPGHRSGSLFSNSLYIFIIRFFPSMANLLVLLYYSRHLDKPTYGTYQNFWIQLSFLYPLACFGIHAVITTYSVSTVVKLARGIHGRQYLVYSLWLLALSTTFALLQSSLGIGFLVPFAFMLSFSVGIIIESFLIVSKSFKVLSSINLVYAIVYLYIHKYVLDHGFSFEKLFIYLLALSLLRILVSVSVVITNIKRHKDDGHEEFRSVAEIRKLWIHLGFYDILQTLSNWIDKFLVSLLLTSSLSAIYFNGTQNIPFLPLILSAAGSSVLMQMTRVKEEDERSSLLQLMKRSTRFLSNIVFPLFFFLIFFRYELFDVLLPGYSASVPIFFISLFMLPFRAYSFITVFQKLHQGHISNIGGVGELILACALMYPLYLWLGLPGVMLSFIISSYSQMFYYFYHISRLLNTSMLNLLPLANLGIKITTYCLLFFFTHYIVTSFFGMKMSLLIGIVIMMATVILSLLIDIISARNVNAKQASA